MFSGSAQNFAVYLLYGIFGLVVLFIIMLLFRELACWYWKINKIVKLLEKIEKNTNKNEIVQETEVKKTPEN